MSKITRKIKTLSTKVETFFRLFSSTKTSKREAFNYLYKMIRYAFGQLLAYSGIGKNVTFLIRNEYRLYLSKSPVAMVAFGDPMSIRDEESIAKQIIQEGDVCLDVGSNIGNFSLCASTLVGKSGNVVAFEAHPATYHYAKRNFSLNHRDNITIIQKAVGEKEGTISFSNDVYDDVNHVQESGGVEVPMVKLDDCEEIKKIPSISCLKIDIEGYELFAFMGGVETLKKTKCVLFELYEKSARMYGYHAEDVYDFLVSLDFKIVDPETREPFDRNFLRKDTVQNLLAVKKL